ncbi:MAG: hypothetical protein C0592_12595 [Marinilabiliales bacterium]|nr:MAG: hypothetical protein C0592_12595 [Marinilabiliales bacterium]
MKRLIIILLVGLSFSSLAQDGEIQAIRDHYYFVKSWVNATDPDSLEYSPYYHDIKYRNVNKSPWRAVGIFQDTTHYFYSDEMEAEEMEGNDEHDNSWALALVINSTQYSWNFEYTEYLFLRGKLIFVFKRVMYSDEEANEYRYYFSDDKLIRYKENSEIKSASEASELEWIQEAGNRYLKSF